MIDEILAALERGESQSAVAREFGISRWEVRKMLQDPPVIDDFQGSIRRANKRLLQPELHEMGMGHICSYYGTEACAKCDAPIPTDCPRECSLCLLGCPCKRAEHDFSYHEAKLSVEQRKTDYQTAYHALRRRR